eukprot:scaffold6148_cov140-Skeletonema_menzelii.AAC.6
MKTRYSPGLLFVILFTKSTDWRRFSRAAVSCIHGQKIDEADERCPLAKPPTIGVVPPTAKTALCLLFACHR